MMIDCADRGPSGLLEDSKVPSYVVQRIPAVVHVRVTRQGRIRRPPYSVVSSNGRSVQEFAIPRELSEAGTKVGMVRDLVQE